MSREDSVKTRIIVIVVFAVSWLAASTGSAVADSNFNRTRLPPKSGD